MNHEPSSKVVYWLSETYWNISRKTLKLYFLGMHFTLISTILYPHAWFAFCTRFKVTKVSMTTKIMNKKLHFLVMWSISRLTPVVASQWTVPSPTWQCVLLFQWNCSLYSAGRGGRCIWWSSSLSWLVKDPECFWSFLGKLDLKQDYTISMNST